jgi:hypothetical protein
MGDSLAIPRKMPADEFCYYYVVSDCGLTDIKPKNKNIYYEYSVQEVINMTYPDALVIPELAQYLNPDVKNNLNCTLSASYIGVVSRAE